MAHLAEQRHEANAVNRTLIDHYRCPQHLAAFELAGRLSEDTGYFAFGAETVCYGTSSAGSRTARVAGPLYDVLHDVRVDTGLVRLPLDPDEVLENLRYERYWQNGPANRTQFGDHPVIRNAYYWLRPFLPIAVRKHLQRVRLLGWRKIPFPHWPIDRTADRILDRLLVLTMKAQGLDRMPFIWFWPDGAMSCAIMTHDVEHLAGRNFCSKLMDLDDAAGVKASFQIVPENRYPVPDALLAEMRHRGFEINIHDLNHDGRLFESRQMEKVYLAVVNGAPRENEWVCRFSLGPDPNKRGRMRVETRHGKQAETQFRVLQTKAGTSLIEARPLTGRTHQIRVHLAECGHPVMGDELYGRPGAKKGTALGLRAVALTYADPFTRRRVQIRAPVGEFVRLYGFDLPTNF